MSITTFTLLSRSLSLHHQQCTRLFSLIRPLFQSFTPAAYRRFDSRPTRSSTSLSTSSAKNVCPNSKHTEEMVNYLTSITKSDLIQLRHMGVRGTPLPIRHAPHLYLPKDNCIYKPYDFLSVLPLFPGSQLDTLMVYDAYHGEGVCEDGFGDFVTYRELEGFVKRAKGFKELVYISANARFLNTNFLGGEEAPQPPKWDRMIKDRDGTDSGAGVEIFTSEKGQRKKVLGYYPYYHIRRDGRIVIADYNRDSEDAIPWDTKTHGRKDCGERDDIRQEAIEGGVEVKLRRGKDADYVQDGKSANLYDDELYAIFAKLTWKEVKEQGLLMLAAEHDLFSACIQEKPLLRFIVQDSARSYANHS